MYNENFVRVYLFLWMLIISGYNYVVYGQVEACQANCGMTPRLIGPRHPATRPHPFAIASYPTASKKFCQLGCQYWFFNRPNNITCKASCGSEYRYKVTVGYSDVAEEARLECEDGCDIAVLLSQAGYYTVNGSMIPCGPGTFREAIQNITSINPLLLPFNSVASAITQSPLLQSVLQCVDCPYGTYRSDSKGTSTASCINCPLGKYANQTGYILFISALLFITHLAYE
jgi:hypothetical protein